MNTEEKIRNLLDEIVEIDILTAELMKTSLGKEITRLMTKREKMIECASKLMNEVDLNVTQSSDGTVVAMKKTIWPAIPFENVVGTGLENIIVKKYPQYLTISSTIRKTDVGNITAYTNSKPEEITSIVADDDYKFIRTEIIKNSTKRSTAPRSSDTD